MKRIILIGLFLTSSICLVAQTTKTYTLTFDENDFSIIKSEKGDIITSNKHDLRLSEDTLTPAIPYIFTHILLPDEEDFKDFTYDIEETGIVPQITLRRIPSLMPTNSQIQSVAPQTSGYPIKDYPSLVELFDIRTMDNYRIACFKVFPISYNAVTKDLKWSSRINISISTVPIAHNKSTSPKVHTGDMEKYLRSILVNPEELSNIPITSSRTRNSGNEQIDYVIITSENLKDAFKPLVDWKITKGVRTKVVTTDSIYANYTGAKNQLKIKSFLYDCYQNNGLKFALLGGDDIIVPVQGCYGKVGDEQDKNIPADLFYACFDNTFDWNKDGDNTIGEISDSVDYYANIHCSRIPVRDTSEVQIFVNRIINYE